MWWWKWAALVTTKMGTSWKLNVFLQQSLRILIYAVKFWILTCGCEWLALASFCNPRGCYWCCADIQWHFLYQRISHLKKFSHYEADYHLIISCVCVESPYLKFHPFLIWNAHCGLDMVSFCVCGHQTAAINLSKKFKAVPESDFYFKDMQAMPGQSCVLIIHQRSRKGSKLFFSGTHSNIAKCSSQLTSMRS